MVPLLRTRTLFDLSLHKAPPFVSLLDTAEHINTSLQDMSFNLDTTEASIMYAS